jgi:hypothetical protein
MSSPQLSFQRQASIDWSGWDSTPFSQQQHPAAKSLPQPAPVIQSDRLDIGQPDKAEKSEAPAKKPKINPLGFLFPVMTLVGTPLMLITSLLGVKKKEGSQELEFSRNGFTRLIERGIGKPLQVPRMFRSYTWGKNILALGILPKTLIGIMYGIQSQQPSMLLAHVLQLPLTIFIMKEIKFATTLVYLMGGLFTLGFINDVQNGNIKEKGDKSKKPRVYDMTRFKQIFSLHSELSVTNRFSRFLSETGKMLKFSAQDHIITTKRAFREINKLIHHQKNGLTDLQTTGSISKSSLGFLLCYAATIPAMASMLLLKNQESRLAKVLSRYSMATTLLSGIMLNFGMFLVALGGKNWAERVPLAGTSLELSGTVMGYATNDKIRPFAVALQQLGAGLNTIFYANRAEKSEATSPKASR